MFAKEINSLILDKKTENTSSVTNRISVSILDDQNSDSPPISDMFEKIKSKLIQKVGDINYYEKYGAKLGDASRTVEARLRNKLETSDELKTELVKFHTGLKEIINDGIDENEAIRVISQHVILSRVFDVLFSGEFTSHNPISQILDKVSQKFGLSEELEELEGFYEDVKREVSEITTKEARQNFIKTIYGNFFTSTSKQETEQHGVVYTPVEIIDFIIHSVEEILNKNFDIGLNDRSVKVLDPFTGTGTFLTRILESGLITDNLYEKYKHDLYANELILLAYYIATVNIETTYSNLRKSGKYIPFDGMSYTDTLRLNSQYRENKRHRQEDQSLDGTFKIAHERIRNQRGAHVHVIVGNPPYSKGQSAFGNYNPNLSYPQLDKRIQDTYAKKTETSNKISLFDSYVRSLRWASDRIGDEGIIAFVTNSSFIDSTTARGIRACLMDEFNDVWCFNLRGNQRTQGEISKQEGGKIFGSGSRAPVAIIFLIKNPKTKSHVLNYKDIGDYLTRNEKLQIIKNAKSIEGVKDWIKIKPNKNFDWINQRIDKFNLYTPICIKKNKLNNENSIFKTFSLGIVSARDSWVYNFSKKEISKNMKHCIDYCNKQNLNKKDFDKKIHEKKLVSWTYDLKNRLRKQKPVYAENKIRTALYRPFCKQFLYYDETFIERPRSFNTFFPEKNSKNIMIIIPTKSGANHFSPFITDTISDLHVLFNSVCFPLFVYDKEKKKMTSNITETTLKDYQTFYKDNKITKEDIFYYVYSLLHHKGYQKKYSANLGKEYPHIPMAPKFWNFSDSGKKLSSLHINYQDGKMYDLGNPKNKVLGNISKMSFGRKKINEKNVRNIQEIWVNGLLLFDNLPDSNYRVNGRTPMEWIVDRYRHTVDSNNKIVNEPLNMDIVSLIKKIVFLSIESEKIINDLPTEFESSNWEPKKIGLDKFG